MFVSHTWPAGLLPSEALPAGEVLQRGCSAHKWYKCVRAWFHFLAISHLTSCFLCYSFPPIAVGPLGWKPRRCSHKSTTVLQSFQRGGTILQRLQVSRKKHFIGRTHPVIQVNWWFAWITNVRDVWVRPFIPTCISVFITANRMHRSFSGSCWISCTQKSTECPSFTGRQRSLKRSTPGLGVSYTLFFHFQTPFDKLLIIKYVKIKI